MYTHKISLGKTPSFAEWAESMKKGGMAKTAMTAPSSQELVKEAQVTAPATVAPSAAATAPVAAAVCKQCNSKPSMPNQQFCADCAKKTAAPATAPVAASAKPAQMKQAATEKCCTKCKEEPCKCKCEKCNKPDGECTCNKKESCGTMAASEPAQTKQAAKKGLKCPKCSAIDRSGADTFKCACGVTVGRKIAKTATKETPKETVKEAGPIAGFTKLGKLTGAQKTFLKSFWSNLYPSDYVNAMLENH
jgi:hypothetical protein